MDNCHNNDCFHTENFKLLSCMDSKINIPYDTKILHGIKFYGFTVVGRTVKLKSINFHYCIAKILSCFDNCKI